jgi:hypothetical protein
MDRTVTVFRSPVTRDRMARFRLNQRGVEQARRNIAAMERVHLAAVRSQETQMWDAEQVERVLIALLNVRQADEVRSWTRFITAARHAA